MKYKCRLCGYICEEKDYKNLSFRCPRCGVDRLNFKEYIENSNINRVVIRTDNIGINRIEETCINCGMCKKTCNLKTGLNLGDEEDFCINCGNCIMTCPTASLTPKYQYKEVESIINKKENIVIAFLAPSIKVSLSEIFDGEVGLNTEKKTINALKKLGFNYVLDTCFGADMTIMEEVKELIDRKKNNKTLPMFTSCCSSWVKFVECKKKEFISNLSTTKSPNGIMGALIKSYFAKFNDIDPKKIVTVGIVPCTSKKNEAKNEYLKNDDMYNIDYMLTTTELINMIKENNIDFNSLEESDYDNLMGNASSSGIIFGTSSGVMEASIRTLKFIMGREDDDFIINEIRGNDYFRKISLNINNETYNFGVIYGIKNATELLDRIKKGDEKLDFLEVMTCDNGCVGGGGQPLQNINKLSEIRTSRLNGLYKLDIENKYKASYQNPDVLKVYNEFLDDKLSGALLHREYKH